VERHSSSNLVSAVIERLDQIDIRHLLRVFFLVSWGGMRLSLLGTFATIWPIVPAPDDRWWWMWRSRWDENWQGKPKYSEKTCPSVTLSTINPTCPDLGSKPATNRLSYGTAFCCKYVCMCIYIYIYIYMYGFGALFSSVTFNWLHKIWLARAAC
jgi:hypothetical protein